MTRQFKRPNRAVLYLYGERHKPLDMVASFTGGAALGYAATGRWGIMALDLAVSLSCLALNHFISWKMRSYR